MRAGLFVSMLIMGLTASAQVHAAAGRTEGTFDVSPEGAATYTVPISVPGGPRGVQPALSLTYNSLGHNGSLGVGWSLGGVSAIERCSRVYPIDPSTGPVTMDTNDRYCLGGVRLRLTAGTYGAANSTYAKEADDFSVITASASTQGAGPQSFTLLAKDGTTYEYGTTPASQVTFAVNGTVLRWMLAKVRDRDGNSYAVDYQVSNGVAEPTTFSWSPTSANGSSYRYSAVLTYEDKANSKDWIASYVAGNPVISKKRLTSISVLYQGMTVHTYKLAYELNGAPVTKFSRLASITECSNWPTSECLPATTMSYQSGSALITSPKYVTIPGANSSNPPKIIGSADFDGDRKGDLIVQVGSSWYVLFGNSDSTLSAPVLVTGMTGSFGIDVDFDIFFSDGRAAFIVNKGGVLYTYTAVGRFFPGGVSTGISHPSGTLPTAIGNALMWIAPELSTGTNRVNMRNVTTKPGDTNPSFAPSITGQGNSIGPYVTRNNASYHVQLGGAQIISGRGLERRDVEGDGWDEFLGTVNLEACGSGCGANPYVAIFRDGGLNVDPADNWSQYYPNLPVQATVSFNDDDCSDSPGLVVSPCSKGTGTVIYRPEEGFWMDWDGDGRSDLLWDTNQDTKVDGSINVDLSTGSGFMATFPTNLPYSNLYRALDLDGDGLDDLVVVDVNNTQIRYYTHSTGAPYLVQVPDLLTSVTDGLGVTYRVDYASTANSNYQVADAIDSAVRARAVVARATLPDGIGGTYTRSYTYIGAREDKVRRTFLGFEERDVRDSRDNLLTKTYYRQAYPRTGWLYKTEVYRDDTVLLSKTESTDDVMQLSSTTFADRSFPYVTSTTSEVYEPQGAANLIRRKVVAFTNYDFTTGNVGKVTTTDTDSGALEKWTSTITTQYAPPASGCLDLPAQITEVLDSELPAKDPITRTVSFIKDGSYCRQRNQIIEPSSPQFRTTTTYGYDAFGNVNSIQVDAFEPSAGNPNTYQPMAPRLSTLSWGSAGVAPETITNALNQSTTIAYYPQSGLVKTITDPNLLTTTLSYDGFGRLTNESEPDQTSSAIQYLDCNDDQGCLPGGNHVLTILKATKDAQQGQQSWQRTYLDRFERPIVARSSQLGLNAQWNEVKYDQVGRITKTSIPCLSTIPTSSCVSAWNSTQYDLLGRVTQSSRPANEQELGRLLTTSITYNGLTTSVTDPLNRTRTELFSVTGQLLRSTDANKYFQDFTYDSAGSLIQVTEKTQTGRDPVLFSAAYAYGSGAFQTSSYDRTLGTRTRWYDGLGELRHWRDAKGQDFFADYDPLSRPVSRSEPDTQTSYVWGNNSSAYNIGRLASMSSVSSGETYLEEFFYDGKARLSQQRITLPNDTNTHSYDYSYDGLTGLLSTITYPVTTSLYRLSVQYNTTNGILTSITEASAGTVFWALDTAAASAGLNARGQITNDGFGGGNIVRARGFDAVTGALERITAGPPANPAGLQNSSVEYDDLGNATQRQNNLGSLPASLTETFHYGDSSDHEDNLTSVTWSNGSTSSSPLTQAFDEAGYLSQRVDLGGTSTPVDMTIGWTSYNYPKSIAASWLNESASFSYGPNRDRWRMIFTNGEGTETTYYLGGLMEMVRTASGTTEYRHYVPGPEDMIALYTRSSSGTNALSYLLTDQQGGIDTIASSAGAALVNESFSAYGLRRDPTDWSGAPSNTGDSLSRQGYTFQTTIGRMGLNHMNGRVQDAITGTFLSPDPFVSDPENPQSWNRYAYTYHNPMSYIDPSGFSPLSASPDELPNQPTNDPLHPCAITGCNQPHDHPLLPPCLGPNGGTCVYKDPYKGRKEEANVQVLSLDNRMTAVVARMDVPMAAAIISPSVITHVLDQATEELIKATRYGPKSILIGREAEIAAILHLKRNGYVILGTHVYVNTKAGVRITDIIAVLPGEPAIGIEVKANGSRRTSAQSRKDRMIEVDGGELRSEMDDANFHKGMHIKYRTEILCVDVPIEGNLAKCPEGVPRHDELPPAP